jgi:CRP/FNR family transcriptional regulator, cyclic AMP receptor protein
VPARERLYFANSERLIWSKKLAIAWPLGEHQLLWSERLDLTDVPPANGARKASSRHQVEHAGQHRWPVILNASVGVNAIQTGSIRLWQQWEAVMTKRTEASREQFDTILQAGNNGLQYLTQNDWALLVDRAKRVAFKKGNTLIQQGKQSGMVYLLLTGKVTIEASKIVIARIGPGQICGEMAFLEDTLASATAIADEDVEAYALTWTALSDMFELFPHLASRFYRSLAVNLSRRLREQISSQGVLTSVARNVTKQV